MEIAQMCLYDNICNEICQVQGIRFAAIINKHGRKVSGGMRNNITPLEQDDKKIEMLFMESTLDLSMRKEFDDSFGNIHAIVSYRDKTTIITIPYQDDLILLSVEPEMDSSNIIQIIHQKITDKKINEFTYQDKSLAYTA